MSRLMIWLLKYRGVGWFRLGTLGPFPTSWQGCLCLGLFVLVVATAALLPQEDGVFVGILCFALYIAIGYWTTDRDARF